MNRWTLYSQAGVEVDVADFGATILAIRCPDRHGQTADVALGFDAAAAYEANELQMGCIVGRYANRIAGGQFTLDGCRYALPRNDGRHHLHGGVHGFGKRTWQVLGSEPGSLTFGYDSADGEEGYPGNLECRLRYSLDDDGGLQMDFEAVTDAPTIVNLTNHAYFNLAGHDAGPVLDHEIMIAAERFTPIDAESIPTGALQPVAGSPFDFRRPAAIGARIDIDNEQLRHGAGYDHNFVVKRQRDGDLERVAEVYEPNSGRALAVFSTEPGLQFYTANHLPAQGGIAGKRGARYLRHGAFCLEAQTFPDAPNQPDFPSPVLRPGERYRQTTIYRFATR